MMPKIEIQKPKYKLKTIVSFAENCVLLGNCHGCGYKKYEQCQLLLAEAMLYYLRQALEKNEKKNIFEGMKPCR